MVPSRFWLRVLSLFALFVVLPGCEDRAQPEYAKCVAAEAKSDVLAAATACEAAVAADPNSTSGKAAASKLKEMQPAIAKAKAENDAADAKAAAERKKADEAAAKSAVAAQAARMALLKDRAKIERSGDDDACVSAGKPPRGLRITGGTYDDNEAVATAMGCVRTHVYYPQQGHSPTDNYYCCP